VLSGGRRASSPARSAASASTQTFGPSLDEVLTLEGAVGVGAVHSQDSLNAEVSNMHASGDMQSFENGEYGSVLRGDFNEIQRGHSLRPAPGVDSLSVDVPTTVSHEAAVATLSNNAAASEEAFFLRSFCQGPGRW
jgi:hypothetical protein